VTITEPDGTILRGEICDVSYNDCDAPQWSGTVGGRSISLTLDRDQYTGECIIGGSIGYEDADWVAVSGCQDLAASFTLGDYTTVAVACKECDCVEEISTLCCGERNISADLKLTMVYPGTSSTVECGDTVLTLSYIGNSKWVGETNFLFEIPDAGGEACVSGKAYFEFFCDPAGPVYQINWKIEYLGISYPFDIDGREWCTLTRLEESCDCPYVGLFGETLTCPMAFWNGSFTFLVEEPVEACS
jgi:hypothetical protein